VVCGEEQLTYNELNRRANQLAHHLQKLGVKGETRVGLCAGRNLAMLVGILGIVKAGGAYVPFDVEYPRERLEYMVKDAGVEVLVTDVNEQQQQMRGIGPPVVCLELEREEIGRESEENPEQRTGAKNLLYVMYTSGSTGRPKGVAVTQRNVVRLVKNSDYAEFSESEVVLQNAPISFDAATMEIWGTLLNGAKLVVYGAEKGSLQDLVQQIQEFGVTTVWLTAGLFHLLVESGLERLTGLRQLMAGGDVLSVQAVKKVLDKLPACRMINGYGPTEGTTFTCCYGMGQGEEIGVTVPIGRPIANTRVYVLDEEMGRVPVGVAGELYIGGDGVAREYWRRPELTAEKFVPNPFVAEDGEGGGHEAGLKRGERLYRTGDRVRWLTGGTLEFLGRMDQQVKVRGYRVEPGEIEATLREHEGVQECAVLVKGQGAAEKKLVAYVAGEATMQELREHLQRKLPEYMVPVVIVVMAEMPLNANGKVDRGALLAMEVVRPEVEGGYKAPRTMLEELLAEIWAEVLNIERVGIHDNFFDLGGHSLLATQVMSRVKEVFHVDAPLRSLFESPTVAELAVQIAVFGNASSQEPGQTRIQTRPRGPDSELPLSYAQERLWFLDHLQPNSDLYNVGVSFAFKGEIDATIMKRALQEIVRRHEVLRTCFHTKSGTAVLEIEEAVEIRVPVVDLTEFEPETRAERARQIAFEHQRKPFILAKPPLINFVLIKLGTGEYILSLAMHHIVTDEWSLGILGRELSALYEAFSRGEKSPLQELAIQYVDYAAWQREWLKGDVLVEQMLYWKNQLKDMPGVLDLPVDRPRPPMPSFRGQIISKSLSPELLNDLKRLGRGENATLFMTLLAAYQVLLMRYSGQEDFGVGTPVANRRHVETEGLIGFFVNTLVMRADLTKHPTFRELLQRVRQSALEAYAHQDLPFEKLVEELQPERNTGRAPLFQTIFVFQHASMTTETSEQEQAVAVKYDLDLTAGESNQCLVISLNYSADLFEPARGRQMLEHYERLLHAVVREPKVCVGELPLLTERERLQISEWNATRVEYERDACIHQLFEAQVELVPNVCAVVYEDHRLTYRELNRRANQLARYLIRRGVGPDARVGLLMPRRPEMIVGILGILKSGGAYVPLDPNYPFERLRHMIKDAEVTALLALDALDRNLAENLPGVIYLRDESAQIDKESDANPAVAAMPENLAYVIYTSGSTGVPKGVAITHRNFCHLHKSQQVNFRVRPRESVLQFFSMSFDAAISEWSMALLAGARLVLSEPTVLMEGKLGSVLKTQEIDTVTLTPSVLQLLGPDNLPKLRTLIVAGESCSEELVLKWGHGRRFLNAYGPTEVTVCATVSGELSGPGKPPIGRPITNAHAYVLDNHMQLCAFGVVGELYVGGAGLARGYWKKPSLTAEKFIPDPFSNEAGQRLYRTGDLVKYREDGNLEFLGRADRQLKLRGFRIELGEIETLLRQQNGITDAVVIPDQQDGSTDMRLVAYVAAAPETRITVAELKSSLRKRLPEYMVPAAVVILSELPLNPNGKLDMRALPAPDACSREEQLAYTPCRTELEQSISKIWQDLLQIEKVGLDDNFFDLGGHSLLIIRMRNEMHRLNNLDLSVVELFTYTTVRSLAEYITKRKEQTTLSGQFEQRALLQKAFLDRRRQIMNKEGVQ
jgi:amino acid adenylation domain-containing protein